MRLFDEFSIREYTEKRISELISPIKRVGKIWTFRCPICGDSKKNKRKARGYYYTDTGTFHCFNEQCHGIGLNIISQFTSTTYDDVKKDYIEYMRKYLNSNREIIPSTPEIKKVVKEDNNFLIPDNWRSDLPLTVRQYIALREVYTAPNIPKNYKMYYNTETNRLVLPWYEDNKIAYYQERALLKDQIPKYKFPFNMEKKIFGVDNIDINFPYIFLVEGLLDSIFIKNGVAIGGISLTEQQRKTLNERFPFHELIYFFDNQWYDEASLKNTIKIAQNISNQKVFIWNKDIIEKDVNEYIMNKKENIFFNSDFLINNSLKGLKIILRFKMK